MPIQDEAFADVDMAASRLHTDEWKGYVRVGHEFAGGHYTVKHKFNEYVRRDGDVTAGVNNCEAFFAILKRGVIGTFHAVSRKHLHRYVSEFEFRWNTRTLDDGARIRAAILNGEGKRLMYRTP